MYQGRAENFSLGMDKLNAMLPDEGATYYSPSPENVYLQVDMEISFMQHSGDVRKCYDGIQSLLLYAAWVVKRSCEDTAYVVVSSNRWTATFLKLQPVRVDVGGGVRRYLQLAPGSQEATMKQESILDSTDWLAALPCTTSPARVGACCGDLSANLLPTGFALEPTGFTTPLKLGLRAGLVEFTKEYFKELISSMRFDTAGFNVNAASDEKLFTFIFRKAEPLAPDSSLQDALKARKAGKTKEGDPSLAANSDIIEGLSGAFDMEDLDEARTYSKRCAEKRAQRSASSIVPHDLAVAPTTPPVPLPIAATPYNEDITIDEARLLMPAAVGASLAIDDIPSSSLWVATYKTPLPPFRCCKASGENTGYTQSEALMVVLQWTWLSHRVADKLAVVPDSF